MNKKVISALLCGAMILGTVSPVMAAGAAEGKTFAIVTKAAGNPYNEKEAHLFALLPEIGHHLPSKT